jgi:hypothetical protein
MENYLAFYSEESEFQLCETYEEAEEWLRDWYDEGFPEETMKGNDFIAKVTHRSKFTETDRKENYKYVYEDDIPEDDDESECWPHDSDIDIVGKLTFEQVEPSAEIAQVEPALSEILKSKVIERLISNKQNLDENYLATTDRVYTRKEISDEIKNETEFGMSFLTNAIMLAIDLHARNKVEPSIPIRDIEEWINAKQLEVNLEYKSKDLDEFAIRSIGLLHSINQFIKSKKK